MSTLQLKNSVNTFNIPTLFSPLLRRGVGGEAFISAQLLDNLRTVNTYFLGAGLACPCFFLLQKSPLDLLPR